MPSYLPELFPGCVWGRYPAPDAPWMPFFPGHPLSNLVEGIPQPGEWLSYTRTPDARAAPPEAGTRHEFHRY